MITSSDGPHASALRKGRISESGRTYFVTTVTCQRQRIFEDFRAARILIGTMRWLHDHQRVFSLAFVVMPDHLHWLFELGQHCTLPQVMRSLKTYSSMAVNEYQDKEGRLWQQGFHDHAVRRDEDLRTLARYVIGNPLRARLVENISEYPYWDAIWLEG